MSDFNFNAVKGVYKNCRGIWAAQWTDEKGQRHTKYFNPKFFPNEAAAKLEAYKFKVHIQKEVEKKGGVIRRRSASRKPVNNNEEIGRRIRRTGNTLEFPGNTFATFPYYHYQYPSPDFSQMFNCGDYSTATPAMSDFSITEQSMQPYDKLKPFENSFPNRDYRYNYAINNDICNSALRTNYNQFFSPPAFCELNFQNTNEENESMNNRLYESLYENSNNNVSLWSYDWNSSSDFLNTEEQNFLYNKEETIDNQSNELNNTTFNEKSFY